VGAVEGSGLAWLHRHEWPRSESSERQRQRDPRPYLQGVWTHAARTTGQSVALQSWLNKFAKTAGESVVKHCRFYLKSILEEAVDQDYLVKNPAKQLVPPTTRKVNKTTLTVDQFIAVLGKLDRKHGLLVRVCVGCGFRPSELFALRWRDFDPLARTFTIRETIYRGVLRPFTKTTEEGSDETNLLTVVIPDDLATELSEYRGASNQRERNKTVDCGR
jgi:integrase